MYKIKKNSGFTLVELLIVVAIIGIVAAISIPNLLRSRMSANETSALAGCKTIATAQIDYYNNTDPHTFSRTLLNLSNGNGAGSVPFCDPRLGSALKQGYTYRLVPGTVISNITWSWSATAWPVVYRSTGVRSFYIDLSGVIRASDVGGSEGTMAMPASD